MSHGLTTSELIAEVKRRASVPTTQILFSVADFEAFLNDEMFSRIVPLIMRSREEFFVQYETTAIVADQAEYDIPSKAIGMKLRDVILLDSANNQQNVPRLSPEEVSLNYVPSQAPYGFMLRANKVTLIPTPKSSTHSLRLSFFRRPNKLSSTRGRQITAIDTGTNTITVSSIPSGWVIGTELDIQTHDYNFELAYEETAIVNISGTDITLTSVANLAVGDYVWEAGYCNVAMIPIEGHYLLAQAAAIKCLEALADHEAANDARQVYAMMEKDFIDTITPRVEGQPKKIVSTTGVFRNGSTRQYTNWRR